MKIHTIFENKIAEFTCDPLVQGIFLTGSMARGTETEYSDLDIIVIYPENRVVEEVRDGVPIETHYNTYKSIIDRFKWDSGSLYLYVYGKIIMDSDGTLQKIVAEAKQMLVDYKVDDERKDFVTHKMQALKEKLTAAIKLNDTLKISYLIHNNFKHVVDYVYMQNSLPVPPQGLTYEIYDNLTVKPSDRWVERLLTLKGIELAEYVLRAI